MKTETAGMIYPKLKPHFNKRTLTITLPPEPPEPPNFYCEVCDEERPGWSLLHQGKYCVCYNHRGISRSVLWSMETSVSHLDRQRVSMIEIVLGDLQNEIKEQGAGRASL